jgi:hypothetical protein
MILYLWQMKLIQYASWQRLVTLRQDEECSRRPTLEPPRTTV